MRLSLSTNWCNRRLATGEEIADAAIALGFDELELGFHTTVEQVDGFRSRLDQIPVRSVHAFCPVPISAPCGHPELYTLASFDDEDRAMARFQIAKNIDFAADIGAETVVLHAGRVSFGTLLRPGFSSGTLRAALEKAKGDLSDKRYAKLLAKARKVRDERGAKLLDVFKKELSLLIPHLEKRAVALALENLPYFEGFPNESEMAALSSEFSGSQVKAWFDTGHHRVRECHGWLSKGFEATVPDASRWSEIRGMHLNDVVAFNDDHLPPGEGKVDFAALEGLARSVRHVVVEPSAAVRSEALERGVSHIRSLWRM